MSVVIPRRHECMVRQYKDLCRSLPVHRQSHPQDGGTLKNRLGNPDLLVLFHRHHLPQDGPERPPRDPGAGYGGGPGPVQLHVLPGSILETQL